MTANDMLKRGRTQIERVLITEGLLMAQAICARQIATGRPDPLLAAMEEIVEKIAQLQSDAQ